MCAVLAGAALVSVAGMTQVPVVARAQATATAAVTATPNSGLEDGQFVVVTFTNFPPGSAYDFRQCKAAPVNILTDCTAIVPGLTVVLDSSGFGNTYVPIYTDADSNLEDQAGTGAITCDSSTPCVIAAMPDQNSLTTSSLVPIAFGQSPGDCPPPGINGIVGAGASAAYRAIYTWESAVCRPPANLSVTYALKTSPDGVNAWLQGESQFAVTGPWGPGFQPVAPASSSPPTRTWKYAPLTASSVVLAYRVYDRRGPQITTLTLTPAQIAQTFEGIDDDWSTDPNITAENPGIEFPTKITPFARADYSEETWTFTSWLAAVAPTAWTSGAQEIFPASLGSTDITGSAKLAFDVVVNPPTSDFFDFGTIGYMDASTAAFYGLPVVNIKNADGSVTTSTPASVSKALADATANADGTVTPNYNPTDGAYPMLLPTYLMAPTNDVTAGVGSSIQQFLDYAVQAGQTTLPGGYVPLTQALVTEALAAAKAIPTTPPPSAPTPKPTPLPTPPAYPVVTQPIPLPVLPSFTPAPTVASTPAPSSTPAPVTAPSAAVVAPSLMLTSSPSQFVFPAVVLVAVLGLLGGIAVEAVGWRRRHARGGDQ
jgi:phosphate transport system substrate-binding protein